MDIIKKGDKSMKVTFVLSVFLLICVIIIAATPKAKTHAKAKAAPTTITITHLRCPMEMYEYEEEFIPTNIWAQFSIKPQQEFKLEVQPAVKYRFIKSDRIMVWVLDDTSQYKPSTNYSFRFSSPEEFVYNGKKIKQMTWKIKTNEGEIFGYLLDNIRYNSKIIHPIDIFLPLEKENLFFIDFPDENGKYKISLTGTFNAGINSPIKDQLERYYTEIAAKKKKTLDWITSQGQNPNELAIIWDYIRFK